MIHTGLSPNTERDDISLALKVLFNPWLWNMDEEVRAVEEMLASFVGLSGVMAVDSGRTSLYTILKALDVGAGDEVAVQAYTCVAVPDPVLWVGAKPLYIDCKEDLTMDVEDLRKKITAATKVIVVQHTFGAPADIDSILKLAREKKIFVIEDCAHALGGTYKGQPLGSLGDAAFWSFGRDKCISSVFGGALVAKSPELNQKIKTIIASYPKPRVGWVIQQLLHPPILAFSKVTYTSGIGKVSLEAAKRLHLISKAVLPTELSGGKPDFVCHQFSPALAVLALHQLKKHSRFLAHRKEIAGIYAKCLTTGLKGEMIAPAFDSNHAYLRYTIFISNSSEVFLKAKSAGIHLGDWYTTAIAPRRVNYSAIGYEPRSCPEAERLAKMTINLPTHIGISKADAEYITDHVFN